MALVLCLLISSPLIAQDIPEITIVYPKSGQRIGAVDSTFIFGHLPPGLVDAGENMFVQVNGAGSFPVHKDGGWLAFVPIQPDTFTFNVTAHLQNDLQQNILTPPVMAAGTVTVYVPPPIEPLPLDSLLIVGDYSRPSGDLVLTSGDNLVASFRGTPGMIAWFEIPGVVDSVPMAETPPRTQPYWGESVFGAGAVPDSMLIRGVYTGSFKIPESASVTDSTIVYHLGMPPSAIEVMKRMLNISQKDQHAELLFFGRFAHIRKRAGYRVSINPPDYPFTVEFADSVQIIRHGPRKGYFSIFQPEGVLARVVGAEGDWYRLQLAPEQFAWAARESVIPQPPGIQPPLSYLRLVRTYAEENRVRVEFPLSGKHPFQIIEDDRRTLRVRLFGVISDTDWIRYDVADSLVDLATWFQPEPQVYEFKIHLTEDIWGYDGYYDDTRFELIIDYPPADVRRLEGKKIVIDPGHSSDPGAIGPTGYTEAEANLGIALTVADMLRWRGAEVTLTRSDNSNVDLYDRPAIAVGHDADLFVSIHNNALPDGVNPFTSNGTSVYYYHPHSIGLARAIHRRLVKATGLPDHGLYHGNLAVNRPTQYPAVLVECAFMMIPEQEARLKTKSFRIDIARAIVFGIEDFLSDYNHD